MKSLEACDGGPRANTGLGRTEVADEVTKVVDLGVHQKQAMQIDPKRAIIPLSASCLATLMQLPPGVAILDIRMGEPIQPSGQQCVEVKVAGMGAIPADHSTVENPDAYDSIPKVAPAMHFIFGSMHWMVCWTGIEATMAAEGGATPEYVTRPDTSLEVPAGPLLITPPPMVSGPTPTDHD